MKWTTDDVSSALFMRDWGVDDSTIAKELRRTKAAVQRKIGAGSAKNGSKSRRYAVFATNDIEAQARHELRRALSADPPVSKPNVGVRKGPRLQKRRIQKLDRGIADADQRAKPRKYPWPVSPHIAISAGRNAHG